MQVMLPLEAAAAVLTLEATAAVLLQEILSCCHHWLPLLLQAYCRQC
jgi:hypothetical protein